MRRKILRFVSKEPTTFLPLLALTYTALALSGPGNSHAQNEAAQPPLSLSGPQGVFAGSETCTSCHEKAHAKWDQSRHSKMVQPATLESVKGDFSRGTVRLQDGDYELRVKDGKFFITESYFEDRRQEHQIDYTLGNRRIQHYLTTLDDGRIVLLPPSWDVLEGEWFHNLEIAAPDQKEGIIAVQLWNKNCFSCHVSEEVKRFDPVDLSYATEWRDFGTSCERCHGPGGEHASHYAGVDFEKGEPKFIVTFAKLDHERRSMVCAQCHSFRDVMAFGYTAGKDYFDHFLPYLEDGQGPSRDPTWYVDGKTRRFSTNALGLWQSECFNEGKLDCLTCHVDVHEPEIEKPGAAPADQQRPVHRMPRGDRSQSDHPHVPRGREQRELLRRVSHAQVGDEHQSDDAGSQHQASRCRRTPRNSTFRTRATSVTTIARRNGRSRP